MVKKRYTEALDQFLSLREPCESYGDSDIANTSGEIYGLLDGIFFNENYGLASENINIEEILLDRGYKYYLLPEGFAWLFRIG